MTSGEFGPVPSRPSALDKLRAMPTAQEMHRTQANRQVSDDQEPRTSVLGYRHSTPDDPYSTLIVTDAPEADMPFTQADLRAVRQEPLPSGEAYVGGDNEWRSEEELLREARERGSRLAEAEFLAEQTPQGDHMEVKVVRNGAEVTVGVKEPAGGIQIPALLQALAFTASDVQFAQPVEQPYPAQPYTAPVEAVAPPAYAAPARRIETQAHAYAPEADDSDDIQDTRHHASQDERNSKSKEKKAKSAEVPLSKKLKRIGVAVILCTSVTGFAKEAIPQKWNGVTISFPDAMRAATWEVLGDVDTEAAIQAHRDKE